MTTRFRAIIVTTLITLLFFLGLSGIVDYELVLSEQGIAEGVLSEFVIAGVFSLLITIGTWWTLFFKRKGLSLLTIGTFPGMAAFPFMLLFVSIITSIFSGVGQLAIAFISSLVFWLVVYLLILTANVLNGAVLFNIPLGQAGKAAQFIFSLISSYFLIAFLFGAVFPIEARIGLIATFVFYFSYVNMWALEDINNRQAWLSAVSITAVISMATLVLSIWPIESIYTTLSLVVILYILLNVALEMRQRIGSMIWLEYAVLTFLIVLILFTNGIWGINGTLV